MERSAANIGCLGMALCLLSLLTATAGERAWPGSTAARTHDRSDARLTHAVVVEVTLVQSAANKQLASSHSDDEVAPRWRRTALGWERAELWRVGWPSKPAPVFDPLLFAALQCMLSLMALIAWPDG